MSYKCLKCGNRVAFKRRVQLVETYAFDKQSETYAVEHATEDLEDVLDVWCGVCDSDDVEWGMPYPERSDLDSETLEEYGH